MSQKSVELVVGRLVTDEEFRRRFEASRETALEDLIGAGLVLTPVERRALLDLDVTACEQFALRLDARLQKIWCGHARTDSGAGGGRRGDSGEKKEEGPRTPGY